MDIPERVKIVESKIVCCISPHTEQYLGESLCEQLRQSINQGRNGKFADDKDVKDFFDAWDDES